MTLTSSITNAVVILIVVVVIVGVVLGLFMSGSDLLNPTMSAAKQRRMDEETQHLAQMNWLEEQKLVEKNRIDIEHARQKAELSLVLLRIREYALTAAGALALVIVAIGTAILLAGLGYRWSRAAPQAAHPITIQNSGGTVKGEATPANALLTAHDARPICLRQRRSSAGANSPMKRTAWGSVQK
jgi:predicted PurR-regulated permease PerM